VVRRNGDWITTLAKGDVTYTDVNAPGAATYVIRTNSNGVVVDRDCEAEVDTPELELTAEADRVVHVSFDGLRSDFVTPALTPNLYALIDNGASTLNARTDPAKTKTLPNHSSQFTGRPIFGVNGHQVDYNNDLGVSIHEEAGSYISSVYDVVHDNGGSTILIAGKSKFDMMERNWNTQGALDITGEDNGTNKIDYYDRDPPETSVPPFVDFLVQNQATPTFGFYHIRTPDVAGHIDGWASADYAAAATIADNIFGELVGAIDAAGIRDTTAFIITSDHGGPTGGVLHDDETIQENYTVPFVIEGPGIDAAVDLYALNADDRTEPGTSQPDLTGQQPIRTAEVANLALDLLGLPSVPGSTFNDAQDLNFSTPVVN